MIEVKISVEAINNIQHSKPKQCFSLSYSKGHHHLISSKHFFITLHFNVQYDTPNEMLKPPVDILFCIPSLFCLESGY